MRLARAATTTLAQSISGAGTLEQAGLGTTVLSGNNAGFTGKVVLGAGTLNLGSAQALGGSTDSRIVFNGGVLQFSENNNTDYSSRFSSEDGQTLKIDTNGRNVAFGATLTGDATSLVKIGKGELVLSGANNTYGGGTTVQSGTLRLVGVQKGAGTIAVNSGKLVYELTSGTVAANITTAADTLTVVSVASGSPVMSGSVSGAGAFVKQGAGSLTMTRSMLQTGGFTLNGGTFNLATPAGATEKISMGGAVVLNEGTLNIAGGVFKLGSTLAGGSLATLQLGADTVFLKSVALNALNIQIPDGTSNLTVFTDETPILTSHTMISGGTVVFKKFDPTTISAQDLAGNVQNPSVMSNLSFDGKSSVNFVNSLSLNGDLQTAPGAKITFGRDITIAGAVQLSGGSVRVTGGTLRALSAPISIGASGAAASLELSGSNTAVVAPKVQLTSGSISVAGDALSTALQGVQTLEVGTSNGTAGAAQLILGGGTGTMTLGAAQTLKGSGTIVGNISLKDESSTLSPGNSPGKITIAGSLDLQGGTLRIEIGKTARDQIDMQGQRVTVGTSASLLIVDAENGALSAGSTLSDIFIGGTLAGNFSPDRIYFMRQTGGQDIFSAMFTASGSLSALTITRNLFANTKGLSYNVRGVATALDTRIIKGKASNESLMELGTGSSIAEASARVSLQLAAANPAAYAELASLSKQRILTLNQELANHFSSLRAGLVDAPEGPYNFWTTGYGTWHKQNADPSMGNAGFSGNTYGDMFGVEKRVGDMVVGVTGAAGSTSANFSALAGRVSTDSWHAGAYAAAALSGYSLESGLVFGSTDSTAYRTIVAPGMNGGVAREGKIRFGGSEWLAHLGVAKPFVSSGSFTVTPSVRLIAAGNVLDSSTESSLDGLEVKTNAQTTYSILQEMGVEARRNLKLVSRPSAVSLRVDWIHDYCNKGRALDMDIAGDSASRFGYKGSDAGADALHLGAGLETAITRRTTLRVSLDYQAQSNASTTRGFLSLGYNF
jgi:autotransporter-associated beta strand protein